MGGHLSGGAIAGIVLGCIGFLLLLGGCVFLKTILDHRRRVRRAVNAASANAPPAVSTNAAAAGRAPRSRYPEAMPCDDYAELFPDEEPARGNVVFQNRADIDRMRDVLVRIEDAGDDRSSEDFTTTEMVSVNNSFAHANVQAGHALQERMKLPPTLLSAQMGSFDNEHNVAMSFVSNYPTPASSMPAFAMRARAAGQSPTPASSINPGAHGSYAGGGLGAPPVARVESGTAAGTAGRGGVTAASHFADRSRGGLRLLVPAQERGHFGDAATTRSAAPASFDDGDIRVTSGGALMERSPLSAERDGESREAREGFGSGAQSYSVHQQQQQPTTATLQARLDANAASLSHHLSPSFGGGPLGEMPVDGRRGSGQRPPGLPMAPGSFHGGPSSLPTLHGGSAGRTGGLLASTRVDPHSLHRAPPLGPRKRTVRIHRQHRMRNVNKGGYVVLEETDSNSSDEEEETQERGKVQREGDTSPAAETSRDAAAPVADASTTPAASAEARAKAKDKEKEKKKRYYFEKLSSLDVYGRAQYMTGAGAGGYPPMAMEEDEESAEEAVAVPPSGAAQQLSAARPMGLPVYAFSSSRKPT